MLTLSPLMPEHEPAARTLVAASLAGTRYLARTAEQLDAALRFEDPEYLAIVAEDDDELVALALFGAVAGARGCTKLHALIGDDDALDGLADAVAQVCQDSGERLAVCELTDDPVFATARSALLDAGFREEGRVYDYVADGVALLILVWRSA